MARKEEPTFPVVHALDLALALRGLGVDTASLFDGLVDAAVLSDPDARLGLSVVEKLLARARSISGQEALGFLLGLQMQVPAHGYLGFAAMTAPTARHALELAVKFAPTRTNALRLSLEVHEQAFLYMDELLDLGSVRDTVFVALAVGIWRIGETLTGTPLVGRAEFAFAEPSYMGEQHGPLSARFNQPRNCLVFDPGYLDLPLTTAHASASQLAQEQCERALAELNQPQLISRVREAMLTRDGEFHDLAGVAKTLGVSERTLKRKLQAEGAAFSEISDSVRCDHARTLLRDPKLSIDEVAERTGYADTSNFTRAFRRWTGKTPAAFRRG